jgi:hypothetical protein
MLRSGRRRYTTLNQSLKSGVGKKTSKRTSIFSKVTNIKTIINELKERQQKYALLDPVSDLDFEKKYRASKRVLDASAHSNSLLNSLQNIESYHTMTGFQLEHQSFFGLFFKNSLFSVDWFEKFQADFCSQELVDKEKKAFFDAFEIHIQNAMQHAHPSDIFSWIERVLASNEYYLRLFRPSNFSLIVSSLQFLCGVIQLLHHVFLSTKGEIIVSERMEGLLVRSVTILSHILSLKAPAKLVAYIGYVVDKTASFSLIAKTAFYTAEISSTQRAQTFILLVVHYLTAIGESNTSNYQTTDIIDIFNLMCAACTRVDFTTRVRIQIIECIADVLFPMLKQAEISIDQLLSFFRAQVIYRAIKLLKKTKDDIEFTESRYKLFQFVANCFQKTFKLTELRAKGYVTQKELVKMCLLCAEESARYFNSRRATEESRKNEVWFAFCACSIFIVLDKQTIRSNVVLQAYMGTIITAVLKKASNVSEIPPYHNALVQALIALLKYPQTIEMAPYIYASCLLELEENNDVDLSFFGEIEPLFVTYKQRMDNMGIDSKFIDPITNKIMLEPVTMPSSRMTVCKSTFFKQYSIQKIDPYDRTPIKKRQLIQPSQDFIKELDEFWKKIIC